MIGILAYGSLISDPGPEILPLIINRIECITPFNVEYARSSKSRNGAPTLIPYMDGQPVSGQILVLDSTDIQHIKDILWRRETHKLTGSYKEGIDFHNSNKVYIKVINNFHDIPTVLYTSIGSNTPVSIDNLSELAINSIEGIKYLQDAKSCGIETKLSKEYELMVLEKTMTNNLQEAYEYLKNAK